MKQLLLLVTMSVSILTSYSQAGKLDYLFGGKGYVNALENPKHAFSDQGNQVLAQSSGKILLFISGPGIHIVRYNADGSLDLSFGDKGYSSVIAGYGALQPDGKIVIAGDSLIQRLNEDGSPDNSFGTGGMLVIRALLPFIAYSVAVQNDGRIVVAGATYAGPVYGPGYEIRKFSLVRYNPDGTPDAGFGSGGLVISLPGYNRSEFRKVAIGQDGKIVAAGNAVNSSETPFLVLKYNANGTPDIGFGNLGILKTAASTGSDYSGALALQADGKILAGGPGTILRYDANGSPDNTFGLSGQIQTDLVNMASLVVQPGGSIVAGGTQRGIYNRYTGSYQYNFQVNRFLPNGSADNTFNGSGKTYVSIDAVNTLNSLTVLPDGKIIAAGTVSSTTLFGGTDYGIASINPDGTNDRRIAGFFPAAHQSGLKAIAVQPDGKVVTAGSGFIYRFNTDGSADSSFSGDGKLPVQPVNSGFFLAVQPDSKILYAGANSVLPLARFNADGSLDNTFGKDGIMQPADPNTHINITALCIQPDGKIVAAALVYTDPDRTTSLSLLRFTKEGLPDNSFNGNGTVLAPFAVSGGMINAVAVQPDGKIVAAGSIPDGSITSFAVARYNPDGSKDAGFGVNGKTFTSFGNASAAASQVLLLDNGNIAVAGITSGDYNHLVFAAYNAAGTIDNNAEHGGKYVADIQLGEEINIIQANGKFLAAGTFSGSINYDVLMARFGSGGTIDTSFGTKGIVTADFGRYDLHPAIAISGKRLYLAETNSAQTYEQTDNYGTVAAFLPEASTPVTLPVANGLKYRYHEGSWTSLPDFNTLTPAKTGTSANVDINARPAGVNTNYAFVWEGYINIPAPGDYTFETLSDDGSRFYFNTAYSPGAIALLNHDGEHYAYSIKETIHIDSAGLYPVAITYFQKEIDAVMQLYWSGPGFSRQLIPDAAFNSSYHLPAGNGFQYRYYEGAWTFLPDFSALTPVKTGSSPNIDLTVRRAGVNTNYALLWEGYINIPAPGDYTFETLSDDGSKFYFNFLYSSQAIALVYNDAEHYAVSNRGTVHVNAAGWYPVTATYFQKEGEAVMKLYWTGPGFEKQQIPDQAFAGSAGSMAAAAGSLKPAEAGATDLHAIKIYPNPFTDKLNIEFNNPASQSTVAVELYDMYGKKLYNQTFRNMPQGINNIHMNVTASIRTAGIYDVKLVINGVPSAMIKLMKANR